MRKVFLLFTVMVFVAFSGECQIKLRTQLKTKVYVLSIGINKYKYLPSSNQLSFCENDANSIDDRYREYAIKMGYTLNNKLLLGEEANYENILGEITKIQKLATENDLVYINFSGHGFKGGIVVYDSDNNTNANFFTYNKLIEQLALIHAKARFVTIDACFAGSIGKNIIDDGTNEALKALNKSKENGFTALICGANSSQTSSEYGLIKHGLLTAFILAATKKYADLEPLDGIITFKELGLYLQKNVKGQQVVVYGNVPSQFPYFVYQAKKLKE